MKLVLAVAGFSLLTAPFSGRASHPPAAAQPASYVHSGTLHAVSRRPPTLTMLTGVGMAFRLLVTLERSA